MMKPGRFSSSPDQAGCRLFKTGSHHCRDNTFHINPSSQNEKSPALLNFSLKDAFVCLTSFKKEPTRAVGEIKIIPKLTNMLKYLYMNSQQ